MAASTKNQFAFHASCLLPQAEVLRYALMGRLNGTRAKTFSVDLTAVEEADISLLQLLVSLRRTAASRAIALTAVSNAYVDDLLARAGLSNWHLADPTPGTPRAAESLADRIEAA